MTCTTRPRSRLLTVLLAALVATSMLAGPASAQDEPDEAEVPRLGISPLDYDGPWFDLEMDAGERRSLSVELANHGGQTTDARTYAADVYSLVGGGMGIGLRDDAVSGSTRWLDYPTQTLSLEPDEGRRRSVNVVVPTDAAPGQYIAALVIENDQPMPADGELSVERVMRQALAINITVPGPAAPALELGDARHTDPGGRSVVLLGVDNPGNQHLSPAGELTLTDASGDSVATHDLEMDILFAGTTTDVELTLDELLAPGTYTIAADLRDDEHDVAATGSAQFEVVAPPQEGSAIPGRDRIEEALRDAGLPAWILLVAVGLTLLILVLLLALLVRRLLRRPAPDVDGTAPSSTPSLPERPAPDVDPGPAPTARSGDVTSPGHPPLPHTTSPGQGDRPRPDVGAEPVGSSSFSARTLPTRAQQRQQARRWPRRR